MAEIGKIAEFEMRVGSWYWVRPERRATMEVEKIRNLSDDELALEGRKAAEQLFRLRFQMKLGQTEGVKKLRELKRDVARINTISRERELGIHTLVAPKHHADAAEVEASAPKPAKKKTAKPAKKKAAKKAAGRKSGGRIPTARKSTAKPSATKKKASRSSSVKKG
ncbi:MAG TPA: 50S ribosomal protein L29 [Acidobacteriaceae bacterium]